MFLILSLQNPSSLSSQPNIAMTVEQKSNFAHSSRPDWILVFLFKNAFTSLKHRRQGLNLPSIKYIMPLKNVYQETSTSLFFIFYRFQDLYENERRMLQNIGKLFF